MRTLSSTLFLVEDFLKDICIKKKTLYSLLQSVERTIKINGIVFDNVHFCTQDKLIIFLDDNVGKQFNLIKVDNLYFAKLNYSSYRSLVYEYEIEN